MTEQEQRDRVARFVRAKMAQHGWDERRLEIETGADRKTIRTFLKAERWPQTPTRVAIEQALELPAGTLEGVRDGFIDDESEEDAADPVEQAIYRSPLTRANQLKLAGIYYEMLDAQAREVRGA